MALCCGSSVWLGSPTMLQHNFSEVTAQTAKKLNYTEFHRGEALWDVIETSRQSFQQRTLIISPAVASLPIEPPSQTLCRKSVCVLTRVSLCLPTSYAKTIQDLAAFVPAVSQLHAFRYLPRAARLVQRQIGNEGKVNPDLSWSALRLRMIRIPLDEQSVCSVPPPMRALRTHSSPVL